eukprot:gene7543-11867_t
MTCQEEEKPIRIGIFGGGGVGKSSCTIRYLYSNFYQQEYNPTIQDVYTKEIEIDSKKVTINVKDTAGQDQLRQMVDRWISECDGYILVYDVTDPKSLDELEDFIDRIENFTCETFKGIPQCQKYPCIIIGNKCDLNELRFVKKEEGMKFSKEKLNPKNLKLNEDMPNFLEVSAKDGFGINEAFESVTRQILYRRNYKQLYKEQKSNPKGFFESLIAWFTSSATKGEAANQDSEQLEEMMK